MENLLTQMTNMMECHQRAMTMLQKSVSLLTQRTQPVEAKAVNTKAVADTIELFSFNTFDHWYGQYEDLLENCCPGVDDGGRRRLLLQRFDPTAYKRYSDFILPQSPKDCSYKETVATCKVLFSTQESRFYSRYKCLLVDMEVKDFDFAAYAFDVNRLCSEFKTFKEDDLRCLVFILGLRHPILHDIRTRLQNWLDT